MGCPSLKDKGANNIVASSLFCTLVFFPNAIDATFSSNLKHHAVAVIPQLRGANRLLSNNIDSSRHRVTIEHFGS